MISLALYKSQYGTWVDRLIDLTTGRFGYSHCELVFADGKSFSSSPRSGGTRFVNVASGDQKTDYSPSHDDHWMWFDLPTRDWEDKVIRRFCDAQDGKGYDWRDAIGCVIPATPTYPEQAKWFCSEVAVAAIQAAGWWQELKPWRVTPNDLSMIVSVACEDRKHR